VNGAIDLAQHIQECGCEDHHDDKRAVAHFEYPFLALKPVTVKFAAVGVRSITSGCLC
jgi:hypothetical protein